MFWGGGRSRPLTPLLTPLSRVLFLTAAALQRCWRRFTVSHLNRVSVVKLAFCKLATCLADSTVQQWRRLDVALRRAATSTFHTVFRLCNAAPAAPRKFRKAQPPTNFFHNALTVPFDCGSRPAGHLHLRSALAPSHPLHIVTHSFIFCVHAQSLAAAAVCVCRRLRNNNPSSLPPPAACAFSSPAPHTSAAAQYPPRSRHSIAAAAAAAAAAPESPSSDCFVVE